MRREKLLSSSHSCTAVMEMCLGFIFLFLLQRERCVCSVRDNAFNVEHAERFLRWVGALKWRKLVGWLTRNHILLFEARSKRRIKEKIIYRKECIVDTMSQDDVKGIIFYIIIMMMRVMMVKINKPNKNNNKHYPQQNQ